MSSLPILPRSAIVQSGWRKMDFSFPGPALENQGGVGAAKPEGIRKRVIHGGLAGDVRNVVKIAVGIRLFLVDSGRKDLIAQRQNADAVLENARAAEKVAGHGLGRTDRQFFVDRAFAEEPLHRRGLDGVAKRRGR